MMTTINFTPKALTFSVVSITLGVWAFYKLNELTGEIFEPIVNACISTEYESMEEFVTKTGYHRYYPSLGLFIMKPLVCVNASFLNNLATSYPSGMISWFCMLTATMPFSVLSILEAGRKGNSGLIMYPTINGLFCQILGISVTVPALWVPSYCLWGQSQDARNNNNNNNNNSNNDKDNSVIENNNNTRGMVALPRAYASIFMAIPGIIISILVFVLDPKTDSWTFCSGILGGPILVMSPLLLWTVGPPSLSSSNNNNNDMKEKQQKQQQQQQQVNKIIQISMLAYQGIGIVAFLLWLFVVYSILTEYGIDYSYMIKDLWIEADSAVQFLIVDAIVLWIGIIIHVAYRTWSGAIQAILLTPVIGPGAAPALILASLEHNHLSSTTTTTTNKNMKNATIVNQKKID